MPQWASAVKSFAVLCILGWTDEWYPLHDHGFYRPASDRFGRGDAHELNFGALRAGISDCWSRRQDEASGWSKDTTEKNSRYDLFGRKYNPFNVTWDT